MQKAQKTASLVGYLIVILLIAFLMYPTQAMDFLLK